MVGDGRVLVDGHRLCCAGQVVTGYEEVDGGNTTSMPARSHWVEIREDLRSCGLGKERCADRAGRHLEVATDDPRKTVYGHGLPSELQKLEVVRGGAPDAS